MKLSFSTPIYTTLAIVAIVIAVMLLPTDFFGTEWTTVQTHMVTFLPWIVIFSAAIGLFAGRTGTMRSDFPMLLTVLICGVIGIILAMVFRTMNASGILIDELLTGGTTIAELMTITVTAFTFIGVIVGLSRR